MTREPHSPENQNELAVFSNLRKWQAAAFCAIAFANGGLLQAESVDARPAHPSENAPGHSAPAPVAKTSADVTEAPVKVAALPQRNKTCTSLRRRAKDIYMGLACVEDGAKYQKISDGNKIITGNPEKGWVYSAVFIKGIFKCAYVRDGVLPKMDAPPGIISKCQDFYTPLVEKRYEYFEDYNCPEARPGLEGCSSATWYSHTAEVYIGDNIMGNFATDDPTPFNVLGTGKGGFSMRRPNTIDKAVGYRTQVKQSSEDGKAIVIRDIENSPILDWGFAKSKSVPHETEHGDGNRRGGTPTEVH